MRRRPGLSRLVAAMILPALAGCATADLIMGPPERAPIDSIAVGSTRAEVEALLGRADDSKGNVRTYRYNLGSDRRERSLALLPLTVVVDYFALMVQPIIGYTMLQEWRDQRAQIGLIFGPDDRVMGLDFVSAEVAYRTWLVAADQEAAIELLCTAVEAGHGGAAHTEAGRRLYGIHGSVADVEAAYRWALMARFAGHPDGETLVGRIAPLLTPEALLAAEARFAAGELPACSRPAAPEAEAAV